MTPQQRALARSKAAKKAARTRALQAHFREQLAKEREAKEREVTTVTVHCEKVVQFKRVGARRPLSDRTEYTVYGDDGKVEIKVTSKAEVTRLVRKRYGTDVEIEFIERKEQA